MKNSFLKAVVVLLCFGLFLLAVPGLNFADNEVTKLSVEFMPSQPGPLFPSLFSWLNPVFNGGSKEAKTKNLPSLQTGRKTGDSGIEKPSIGD